MEKTTVKRTDGRNISFTGELLASTESSENNASSYWSGETGRWTKLRLYKTKGGKYVCQRINYTCWQGEKDIYEGRVCDTLEEVFAFFGPGWLAKDLYSEADLDDAVEIE